jgi:hypothetical protein
MKRHTLAERIRDETGLTVKEFTAQLGIKPDVLQRYHNSNRVMLKIILAGYRAEVRGEVVGLA